MSKEYVFVWNMGTGSPIEAHLNISTIAWLIGTLSVRCIRIFTFTEELLPKELIPLINKQSHEVALMDPVTGKHVACCGYPYVD